MRFFPFCVLPRSWFAHVRRNCSIQSCTADIRNARLMRKGLSPQLIQFSLYAMSIRSLYFFSHWAQMNACKNGQLRCFFYLFSQSGSVFNLINYPWCQNPFRMWYPRPAVVIVDFLLICGQVVVCQRMKIINRIMFSLFSNVMDFKLSPSVKTTHATSRQHNLEKTVSLVRICINLFFLNIQGPFCGRYLLHYAQWSVSAEQYNFAMKTPTLIYLRYLLYPWPNS